MRGRGTLARVLWGSFFIQSSWSFTRMQGIGFGAAVSPALEDIYDGGEACRDALKRHSAYYNSHPYMGCAVLGASVRLEEMASLGECAPGAATEFKKKVMGVFGALGDEFFWGSLRPFAAALGALAVFSSGVWGVALFLGVFNAVHLRMRCSMLAKGAELGEGVAGYVSSLALPRWSERLRAAACAALGVLAALAVFAAARPAADGHGAGVALVFVPGLAALGIAVFLLGALMKKGMSPTSAAYLVLVPLIVYGVIAY